MTTRTDAIAFAIRTLADKDIISAPDEPENFWTYILGLETYDYRRAREIEAVIDNVCAKVKTFRTNRQFNKIVQNYDES